MRHIKKYLLPICIVIVLLGVFLLYEIITTYKAHETFDGYCRWRGLTVENRTSGFGYCKNPHTEKEYKIVLFKGRWYLDGDLPCGFLCF